MNRKTTSLMLIAAVLAIASVSVTNTNAQGVEKLNEITRESYQNVDMLKQMTSAIEACTAGMTAFDMTVVEPCGDIISNVNGHLNDLLSESRTDIDTVTSKYGYGLSGSSSSSSNNVDSNSDYRVYTGGPFSEEKCRAEPVLLAAYCWK